MPPSPTAKLMMERISQTTSRGGFQGVLSILTAPEEFKKHISDAKEFVREALLTVRSARDADPNWTDDGIAQRILDGIEEGRKTHALSKRT